MEAAAAEVEGLLTVSATGDRAVGRALTGPAASCLLVSSSCLCFAPTSAGDCVGLLLLTGGSGEEGPLGDLRLPTGLGGGIIDSSLLGFAADSGEILLGDFLPSLNLGAGISEPLLGLGDFDLTSLLDPLTEAARPLLLFASPLLSLLLS